MQTYPYRVSCDATLIHFPETKADLKGFGDFLSTMVGKVIGLDTETTGLNIYGPTFACRLVQFGNASEAWVLRADLFREDIILALADPRLRFVCHNAPFDLLVLDRTGLATLENLGGRVFDTYVLAHLLDPRSESDGGAGLGLKALSGIYVDADAADTSKALYSVFHKEYKATKVTGWALIDIDHPLYVTYAGLDVIYVSRLLAELTILIRGNNLSALAQWEHKIQLVTARQQRRGLLIDTVYTQSLVGDLAAEAEHYKAIAADYGVENVNSTKQVIEALEGMGETWTEKTDGGSPSVGKTVLLPMADLEGRDWTRLENRTPNPLADAVVRAKRAKGWGTTYAQTFLDLLDTGNRIHPFIRPLAARTARMSVSMPPLQQLPSSDWTIRRCIVADPGKTIIAADYKSMEMRVLAALANVTAMKTAIREDRDLHDYTAGLIYGGAFTKAERRYAKTVGLGTIFGGGAKGLAQQIGAPLEAIQFAVGRYGEVYPEVNRYSKRLQREANYGGHEVITPYGRHLPLDRDRAYACVNYVVQSTARDLICKALIAIEDAGLGSHILLPVHDEVIAQADTADAPEVIREIGLLMESEFLGVQINSDTSVYGPSWGHGYGAPM